MLEEILSELKMMGALEFYNKTDMDKFSTQSYLKKILEYENSWRKDKRTTRRLKTATFSYDREWCQIDEKANIKINFKEIRKKSCGDFIDKKKNLCFIGAPGLGKTHCLIAIGRELCRRGYTVKFYTAIDLVTRLEEAKENNTLSKEMNKLLKPHLLIIDELGFVPLSNKGARLLFDVFSKRYENGPIAISTNLSFPKWTETFGSIELTNALIDRFTHRCDIYTFEGESYRFMESKKKK